LRETAEETERGADTRDKSKVSIRNIVINCQPPQRHNRGKRDEGMKETSFKRGQRYTKEFECKAPVPLVPSTLCTLFFSSKGDSRGTYERANKTENERRSVLRMQKHAAERSLDEPTTRRERGEREGFTIAGGEETLSRCRVRTSPLSLTTKCRCREKKQTE
jgi:hypothetical protein